VTLLPDIGIHGNSHMLMQDKNSLEIDWLVNWINEAVGARAWSLLMIGERPRPVVGHSYSDAAIANSDPRTD
jgi:hypothetical protein